MRVCLCVRYFTTEHCFSRIFFLLTYHKLVHTYFDKEKLGILHHVLSKTQHVIGQEIAKIPTKDESQAINLSSLGFVQNSILFQLITIQRQVFDFLGYMWLPIIANFTNILLIIFGSFGAVQYITKYLFAVSNILHLRGKIYQYQ